MMTSTTTLFLVLYHSSQGHTCTITTFMLLMKRGCHNSPTLQEISTANGFSMNIELKMHGSCGRLSTSTMIWTNLQQPISSHNKTHHNARTSRPFQKKHSNTCTRSNQWIYHSCQKKGCAEGIYLYTNTMQYILKH